MATIKKGVTTSSKEWAKHLRKKGKKIFWRAERKTAKKQANKISSEGIQDSEQLSKCAKIAKRIQQNPISLGDYTQKFKNDIQIMQENMGFQNELINHILDVNTKSDVDNTIK